MDREVEPSSLLKLSETIISQLTKNPISPELVRILNENIVILSKDKQRMKKKYKKLKNFAYQLKTDLDNRKNIGDLKELKNTIDRQQEIIESIR